MPEVGVGLMARYPRKGKVKTRLAAEIGEDRALDIYRQLLGRAVTSVTDLDSHEFYRAAFVEPANRVRQFRQEFRDFDQVGPQQGTDLGQRMQEALRSLLSVSDVRRAMLVGSDIPQVESDTLIAAAKVLKDHDLVLGPASDGGYYLIGLKQVHPHLFADINWGTPGVFDRTVQAAATNHIDVGLLPQLRDLDTPADLLYFTDRKLVR